MPSSLSRFSAFVLLLLLFVIVQGTVYGADFTQDQKLTSADFVTDTPLNVPDASFSKGLAVSGNWMAVGAPGDNQNQGAVKIYERVSGAWQYRTQILPPAGQAGSEFGSAVDIYESGGLLTVIVGAPLFDSAQTNQGRAYVYSDTNASAGFSFSPVTIDSASAELNGRFGYAVALHGDLAAISEPNDDITNAGLVSIRGRNNGGTNAWGQAVAPKGGNLGNGFGTSIDLHGEYLIVGAPYASNGVGIQTGRAYVYGQNQGGANAWGIKHTLSPSISETAMAFGFSVGIWDSNTGAADSASRSMVGAPMSDNSGFADVGSVFFFNDATSNFTYSHIAAANNVNAHFGYSVAIEGDNAIAGRPSQMVSSQAYTGQVDTFNFSGGVWATNTINLTQTGAQAGYYFGHSVDVSGLVAVIGAPNSREDALNLPPGAVGAGVVETLEKPGATWAKDTDSYVRAAFDQPNTAINQSFGYSTDMTDQWLAVGVTGDGQKGANAGAVYMYQNVSGVWTPHSKLTALFGKPGDEFGKSVAIEGNKLVVGAPSSDGFPSTTSNSGAIYIFDLIGGKWVQTLERMSPNPTSDGYFGYSLDFDGDVVVVGAYRENGLKGRAYAFRDLSTFLTPLTLDIAASVMHGATGWSVSVYDPDDAVANNEVIAIGAPADTSTEGRAYVLSGANFTTVTGLADPALGSGRFFGYSVSIDNGRVAVGAPTTGGAPSGGVVIFSGGGYATADTLTRPSGAGQFGYDVHLENNSIVVGSTATAGSAGSATVFGFSAGAWTEQGPLQPSDLVANDAYGTAVTQYNGSYVVTAPTHDPAGIANAGAAYAFSLAPEVTVDPTTLSVDEEGETTDTFVVSLNQTPATNVTIQLTFNTQVQVNTGSGFGASPQTVTLTPANALTGVTVTVRAVDDPIDEADPHTATITTSVTSSSTSRFNGLAVDDITVDIADNDTAGVSITQSDDSTDVSEAGTTDTYTIVLDTQPSAMVNVAITFPDTDVTVNGDADGTFNTTFNAGNWDDPQTITVAAVNDRNFESGHTGDLVHAFTSADTGYEGITASVDDTTDTNTVTANITDNETLELRWVNATGSDSEGQTYIQNVVMDITSDPTGGTPQNEVAISFESPITYITAEAADIQIQFISQTINAGNNDGTMFSVFHDFVVDGLVEGDETFEMGIVVTTPFVGLTTGADHIATILDGSSVTASIATTSLNFGEDIGTFSIPVTLNVSPNAALSEPATVVVELNDNTAVFNGATGDMYFDDGGTPADSIVVTFPAGSDNGDVVQAVVTIVDDQTVESSPASPAPFNVNEQFSVTLGATTGVLSAATGTTTVGIDENDFAYITVNAPTLSVDESDGTITQNLRVRMVTFGTGSQQLQDAATVPLENLTYGSAAAPADYTVITTSVTIPAGALNNSLHPFDVSIVDDDIDETNEYGDVTIVNASYTGVPIIVPLSASNNCDTTVNPGLTPNPCRNRMTIEIEDDDEAGIVVTESGTTAVAEGGTNDSYMVVLGSEPAADVTINIAFDPAQLIVNGESDGTTSLTFTPSDWDDGQTVTVVAVDDTLVEANPHTSLITQTVSSADAVYNAIDPADVMVTITENDIQEITFSAASSTINETAGTHIVTARLNIVSNGTPGGTITSDMTANINVTLGSAEAGDFTLDTLSVTFPAGSAHNSTLPIGITIANDLLLEGDETFDLSFTLVTTGGTANDTHTVTITDDETATIAFNSANGSTSEGVGSTGIPARLTITGTGDGSAQLENSVSVAIVQTPGTALTPDDYALPSLTLNFASGQNSPIVNPVSVQIVNDLMVENNETFTLGFGAVTGPASVTASGTHIVTINENDSAVFAFAANDDTVAENAGTFEKTVTLTVTANGSGGTPRLQDDFSIPVSFTEITADEPEDFTLSTSTLVFIAGTETGATLSTEGIIVDDSIDEDNETFSIQLSNVNATPYITFGRSTTTFTITDNDTAGIVVTQSGGSTAVTEGAGSDSYLIALSSEPTADVEVDITFDPLQVTLNGDSDGALTVTLNSGNWDTGVTLTVAAVNDTIVEGAHSTTLSHVASSADASYDGFVIDDIPVSITDNDTAEVIFSGAGFSAFEGANFSSGMTLKVTANGAPGGTIAAAIVVDMSLTLGTAEASDVSITTAQATFPAGSAHDTIISTHAVSVTDDLIVERTEDFTLSLSINSGLATTTAVNIYSILSDDTAAISYAANSSNAPEATSPHTITAIITLGGSGTGVASIEEAITVGIVNAPGTAATPDDYTVSTTSISFPAGTLSAATANINSTIVNDNLIEGAHTFDINFGLITTDATGVSASGSHTVTIVDDDFAGVTIVESADSTDVTEGIGSDTFTITLNAEPTSDVTITFDVGTQVTFAPNPLVISPANWNVAQTVTVTAVDDIVIEGPHNVVVGFIFTGDADFAAITPNSISVDVNITDNDVPGITITESDGSTNATEGGAGDSYSIVLLGAPTQDVIITLNGGTQVTTPTTLTFTPMNYNVPQDVAVTAIDDLIYEGAHTGTITHTVTSADTNYNGFTVGSVTVNITDGVSELLENGSFEIADATEKTAQKWVVAEVTNKDRRLCTSVDPSVVTADGDCVWQFRFNGPTNALRTIKQKLKNPAWGDAGDTLVLSAQVTSNAFGTGGRLMAIVVYTDGTTAKAKATIPSGTYGYTPITTTFDVTKRIKQVKIKIKVGSATGRVWIDDVSLLFTEGTSIRAAVEPMTRGTDVLPLPPPPPGWRQ